MTTQHEPTFAETLDGLITARGWTQQYVAQQLDVYSADVGRWRRGKGGISIQNVRKIARLFDVEPAMLERLAGYADTASAGPAHDVDPSMEALLDSETAAMRERLRDYPPAAARVVIGSWRTMADTVDAALRAQFVVPPASANPRNTPAAKRANRPQRKLNSAGQHQDNDDANGPLTLRSAIAKVRDSFSPARPLAATPR